MSDNDISGAIDRIVRLANDAAKTDDPVCSGATARSLFHRRSRRKTHKAHGSSQAQGPKAFTPLQLRQFILDQGGVNGIVYLSDKSPAIFQYDKETPD